MVGNAQLSDWETGNIQVQERDTNYVKEVLDKADELRFSNPDTVLLISEQALALSEKLKFNNGIAESLRIIGLINIDRGNYFLGDQYFQKSLKIFQEAGDLKGVSRLQNNLGAVYQTMGNYPKALELFIASLRNGELAKNPMSIGTAYVNIGTLYSNDELTYEEAIENYQKSIPYFEEADYALGINVVNINLGELYLKLDKPESSLPILFDAITGFQKAGLDPAYALNLLAEAYFKMKDFSRAQDHFQQALTSATEKYTMSEQVRAYLGLGNISIKLGNPSKALDYFEKALGTANDSGLLRETSLALEGRSKAYAMKKDYMNAYRAQQLFAAVDDSLRNMDYERDLSNLRTIVDMREREYEREYENQRIQYELERNLEKEKEQQARLLLYVGLGVFVLITFGLANRFLFIRKAKNQISKERDRSDAILLNILPEETAEELKINGSIKAKKFNEITVAFTDFKGFSLIAEELPPEQLVESVDYYFKHFDATIEKYGLEKIKTIGDAYMFAGGIPKPNKTHAEDAMKAAIEIRDFVNETKNNPPPGIYPFEIRIGLNSGPVVAGVVGTKKFAYDIWGSTVNFAARMESGSQTGRINVSENTYQLLKDKYPFTYRGEMEVKNGQMLKMYFAEVESQVAV